MNGTDKQTVLPLFLTSSPTLMKSGEKNVPNGSRSSAKSNMKR